MSVPPTRPPDQRMSILLGIVGIVAAILVAYNPALLAGFVWDDQSVTRNPQLDSMRGLWQIWFSPGPNGFEEHYWPMVYTIFWLERRIWDLEPFGFHLVNILLHATNSCILWLFLRRQKITGAYGAGLIFALHPVHVESVAWVIELKDVLSGLFYLLSFCCFVSFSETTRKSSYAISLVSYALGMLSKSVVVTLPAGLLVYLWWKTGSIRRRDVIALLPFGAVACAILAVDLHSAGLAGTAAFPLTATARALIAGRAFWFYAGAFFWPASLSAIYPQWTIDTASAFQYLFPAAAIFLFATLFLCRKWIGRVPLASVLFFFIGLLPTLGFIRFSYMKHSYVADRFQYLASIGLTVPVAALLDWLSRHWKSPALRIVPTTLVCLALGALTWQEAGEYHSFESLFTATIRKNPEAWVAWYNLAWANMEKGDYVSAEKYFVKAIELHPEYAEAHANLGVALKQQGRSEEASRHFRLAIRFKPQDVRSYYNLGLLLAKEGKLKEAEDQFQQALRIAPDLVEAWVGCGSVLAQEGKRTEAAERFRKALELEPGNELARNNLRTMEDGTSATK